MPASGSIDIAFAAGKRRCCSTDAHIGGRGLRRHTGPRRLPAWWNRPSIRVSWSGECSVAIDRRRRAPRLADPPDDLRDTLERRYALSCVDLRRCAPPARTFTRRVGARIARVTD